MKTTLRIVELKTGQFAVQKRESWRTWGFMGKYDTFNWGRCVDFVEKYCLMSSLKEAEQSLQYIIHKILEARMPNPKIPRVVRVIKKVKV